jgi:hypothetical protein
VGLDLHIHLTVHDDESGLKRLTVDVPHGHLIRRAVGYQFSDQTVIELNAMMPIMDDESASPAIPMPLCITAIAMFHSYDIAFTTYRAFTKDSIFSTIFHYPV